MGTTSGESELGVTQPPRDDFEPYPWKTDDPQRPRATSGPVEQATADPRPLLASDPEPADPPARTDQPVAYAPPPPPVAPLPPPRGVSRRRLLAGIAGAAGLIGVAAVGAGIYGSLRGPSSAELSAAEATQAPEDFVEDEDEDEDTTALLDTPYGELVVDVPAGWDIVSEGDLLVLAESSSSYRVVARVPERLGTSDNDLRREADYLRDEFSPTGESVVSDESTNSFDILKLQTNGVAAKKKSVEQVTFIVEQERTRGMVVSLVLPVDGVPEILRAARGMVTDLLRGFQES